ncbi:TonB-dependent receptor domain-containing protein [Tunturiibacter gelidiferens]|uniref:TonB-dependent receptor domain-containing protein n=1 Tax=Tunturiibacter gelidiferens TaxID=3069689 RepID=UPI003D9AF075
MPVSSTTYNGPVRPYNLFHHDQTNDAFSVIWNHIFSGTFLNEARANAAGWRFNEVASNPQAPLGLPQDTVDAIGSLNATNTANTFQTFGFPGPADFNQWTYTYKDVATKVQGNHTIKFGGELTRLSYLNNPTYAARPSYNFYNIWDFLNDAPHTENGSFSPITGTPTTNRQDDRENLWGFFVQDDWKIRPNLTFNIGLRYTYLDALYTKQNNLSTVVLGSGASAYTGLSIRHGGHLWSPQKGNFGPQFGFAWSPDAFHSKFVLRGGYGLNYNEEEIAITGNAYNNPRASSTPPSPAAARLPSIRISSTPSRQPRTRSSAFRQTPIPSAPLIMPVSRSMGASASLPFPPICPQPTLSTSHSIPSTTSAISSSQPPDTRPA